jgi:tRNA A-37 threonylcarbamoyl transferase component Bud32
VTIGRSPADVLRLVVAVVLLVVYLVIGRLFGASIAVFAYRLLRGLDALGENFVTVLIAVVRLAGILLVVVGLGVMAWRGRWRLLVSLFVAAVPAALVYWLFSGWVHTHNPTLVRLSHGAGPLTETGFPTGPGIAALAAGVTAAAPWLSRWQRRLSWAVVAGFVVARFVAEPVSGQSLLAVLVGWTAGAAALVFMGSPLRRASRESVITGLRRVGIDVATLQPASVDARGSTPYFGTDGPGDALFVKALGRDERSADLLFRIYRAVLPRQLGDERPFSSLRRAIEHEAVVALVAGQLGVRTPRLLGVATAEPNSFVLAYEGIAGRSLDRVEPSELTDTVIGQVWEQIRTLRTHRIAHRDLRLANVFLDDHDDVWIIDFGFSELAASDLLLSTDLAEAVASQSLKIGAERAARQAIDELGADVAATAVPRLAPGYLSGATRTALKAQPTILPQLRTCLIGTHAGAGAGDKVTRE